MHDRHLGSIDGVLVEFLHESIGIHFGRVEDRNPWNSWSLLGFRADASLIIPSGSKKLPTGSETNTDER